MVLGAGLRLWGSEEGRGGGWWQSLGVGLGQVRQEGPEGARRERVTPGPCPGSPSQAPLASQTPCAHQHIGRGVSLTCCSGHPTVPGEPGDTPAFGARTWDPEVSQGKVKSDSVLELFL